MAKNTDTRGKTKTFLVPSVEPAVNQLRTRLKRANLVVKALRANGGRAVDAPFGVGKGAPSPTSQARALVANLEKSIAALQRACPNDFSNTFVLETKKRRR